MRCYLFGHSPTIITATLYVVCRRCPARGRLDGTWRSRRFLAAGIARAVALEGDKGDATPAPLARTARPAVASSH